MVPTHETHAWIVYSSNVCWNDLSDLDSLHPSLSLSAAGWPTSSLVTVATSTSWRETDTKASTETTTSTAPRLTPTRCSPFVGSSTKPSFCLPDPTWKKKKTNSPWTPSSTWTPRTDRCHRTVDGQTLSITLWLCMYGYLSSSTMLKHVLDIGNKGFSSKLETVCRYSFFFLQWKWSS